jgi:hypothetical protein
MRFLEIQMQIRDLLLAGMAATAVAASSRALAQNITVVVNGQPVTFNGQPPIMQDDRVFVPLRGVFEDLGAHVDWNPSTQTVTAFRGHTKVQLTIGQTTASVDGKPVQLDVPAQIIQGSTMVPLRFVGEALGNNVRWDAGNQSVIISGGGDYHIEHGGPPPPPPPYGGPPIYVGANDDEIQHPIYWQRDTSVPISFGIEFDWGHVHAGQPIYSVLPHYPGLPANTRVQGTVTNITTINNVQHYTINYNTIVTPSGRKIPFQGHATGAVPRGASGGHAVAPTNVSMKIDRPVQIQPRKAPPVPRAGKPPVAPRPRKPSAPPRTEKKPNDQRPS